MCVLCVCDFRLFYILFGRRDCYVGVVVVGVFIILESVQILVVCSKMVSDLH